MKKLIVGLGNPGTKYRYTRHNTGFIVLDNLANSLGIKKWKGSERFKAKFVQLKSADGDVLYLLKPQTYMNDSGSAVASFMKYYDITPKNLLIINDELDLPFGTVKKQFEAGSAGHNGVEDVINKLGSKGFWRLRVGIGRPTNKSIAVSDWVLTNFSTEELAKLAEVAVDF
jgi:peptidyl-tRNA hydrolase, PTH1 family